MTDPGPICIEPTIGSRVPAHLLTYITEEQLCAAADKNGVDRWLFCAILERESAGGTSKDLDRPGPGGTGDFGKRTPGGKYGTALPPDGRGWGRGLFQIDYGAAGGAQRAWVETLLPDGRHQWEDPALNAGYAAGLLGAALTQFGGDQVAMVAAYNAGGDGNYRVARVLGTLPADASTSRKVAALDAITTDNYVSWVLAKRDSYLNTNPQGG